LQPELSTYSVAFAQSQQSTFQLSYCMSYIAAVDEAIVRTF
jgi:hypothetical protein